MIASFAGNAQVSSLRDRELHGLVAALELELDLAQGRRALASVDLARSRVSTIVRAQFTSG